MTTHAQLSPSSTIRWMTCPGSVALCKDLVDVGSKFADEGTDAHELAALCLETNTDSAAYAGRIMAKGFPVNAEMVLAVQDYLDYVRGIVAATNGQLMIEQRLPISHLTGEADAHGTSDVVILAGDELIIVDLKYGRGLAVEADNNPQLQVYALASLEEFGLAEDFKTVRMVIHQPRLGTVSEWTQSVADLEAFGQEVWNAAIDTRKPDAALKPSVKGCKFCRAKATCPAIRAEVMDTFEAIPEVLDADAGHLSQALSKADLIEGWLKAIRAEVESRLYAGLEVPGFKVVQGKRGNRAWSDKTEAEAMLKSMRVPHDQMYDYSVISPTSADKLAKLLGKDGAPIIGPRQWPKVQSLITQSEGKPSVAPNSDKRPALAMTPTASDFDVLT
jgi:hypothetical protein